MADFYDSLAPYYHLIYPDWHASLRRQSDQLAALIASEWPAPQRKVLEVACGIGTQAIGLALQGHAVTASDLSVNEVKRLRHEAALHGVAIVASVCDMRQAHAHHGSGFGAVVCADNSLPHLLTDDDVLLALQQMLACLAVGGGCVVTVRDGERAARGRDLVKPHGVRVENGKRYLLFQVWDFERHLYDLSLFIVEEDLSTGEAQTHVMRSRYWAVSTNRLCELMRAAGFQNVRRIDGAFYQPVLVGTRVA